MCDFLSERRQRAVLNGQASTWTNVTAGVPQGSILGPLFLIYRNDLSEGLSTNAKLFADDKSLFSVIHDSQSSANDLNKDLEMIHNWAFQWGPFNNYVALKLTFFEPPTPHHHASSRMITRPPLRFVTPDTDTRLPFIICFSFLKLKRKTKIRTHP